MATFRMENADIKISGKGFKACPFCGNQELTITNESSYNELCDKHGSSMLIVKCEKCDTEKNLFGYDIPNNNYWLGVGLLIEKWNRRTE